MSSYRAGGSLELGYPQRIGKTVVTRLAGRILDSPGTVAPSLTSASLPDLYLELAVLARDLPS